MHHTSGNGAYDCWSDHYDIVHDQPCFVSYPVPFDEFVYLKDVGQSDALDDIHVLFQGNNELYFMTELPSRTTE